MLTYPEIDPVIFSVFGLKIRWYGMMYVVGFVVGWWLARRRSKAPWAQIKPEQVDDLVFYVMLGVILGGRLGYTFFYGWAEIARDPLYIFKIWEGGMSFHGGLAGVLIAIATGARHRMTSEQWDAFAATGTSHLMAISGLHIGLAASCGFLIAFALSGLPVAIAFALFFDDPEMGLLGLIAPVVLYEFLARIRGRHALQDVSVEQAQQDHGHAMTALIVGLTVVLAGSYFRLWWSIAAVGIVSVLVLRRRRGSRGLGGAAAIVAFCVALYGIMATAIAPRMINDHSPKLERYSRIKK